MGFGARGDYTVLSGPAALPVLPNPSVPVAIMIITGTVTVRLKEGVLDPQGQTIRRALEQIGYAEVEGVRTGRTFAVRLEAPDAAAARTRLEEMSQKLLANPVIEVYSVEVHE